VDIGLISGRHILRDRRNESMSPCGMYEFEEMTTEAQIRYLKYEVDSIKKDIREILKEIKKEK
jgi:hypothetical protein